MNILYIGPYRENNGLGRSSRRWLSCLTSDPSNNVSSRPVYLTQNIQFHNDENFDFSLTENNQSDRYDYVIQHGTPDIFMYNKKFGKNVGMLEAETSNIYHSGWIDKINMMDEIIVGSSVAKQSLINDGVFIPIKIIPEPYNNYEYSNKLNFFNHNQSYDSQYIFYTIGQYFEKKNILGITLAFLLEFSEEDDARLFIKTGDYYKENKDIENIIKNEIVNLHKAAKRHPINDNKIDILCGILRDEDIYRLHNSANCYVNAVKSDSTGACVIEAKLCDNTVINTKGIGSCDFINSMNDLLVDSIDVGVYSRDFYNPKTFTTHEQWKEPDVNSLRRCMRYAYENNKPSTKIEKNIFTYQYALKKLL